MTAAAQPTAWEIAAGVPDPELPMVTLADLGILRAVAVDGDAVTVTITPTYSGCPALPEMGNDLRSLLRRAGFADVTVRTQLSPPWSSADITAAGRRKLVAAGIAPPAASTAAVGTGRVRGPVALSLTASPAAIGCPRCGSHRTREMSRFGTTACKALYRCLACAEPFEYVKDI